MQEGWVERERSRGEWHIERVLAEADGEVSANE